MKGLALLIAGGVVATTSCSFQHGSVAGVDAIGDAGPDADGLVIPDVPNDCTFSAWSTPQPIAELNGSELDARPRLSPDELTIFFYSLRSGDRDVYMATRATTSAPFDTPVNVSALNTVSIERDPAATPDLLEVIFTSTRDGTYQIYRSTRTSTSSTFSTPQPITAVNSASLEYFTGLSHDGLALVFCSNRPGGAGGYDIYISTRPATTSEFSAPQGLAGLNTASNEYAAVLSADGREVIFSSDAGGSIGIWSATRPDANAAFGTPSPVPELGFAGEEHPGWLSVDGLRFYYSNESSGVPQIYMATRTCE